MNRNRTRSPDVKRPVEFQPLNQLFQIELTPSTTGEIAFACAMNMLHGSVVVQYGLRADKPESSGATCRRAT